MNEKNYVNLVLLSYKVTKEYPSIGRSMKDRTKLISSLIKLDDRKLLLDITGEGLYAVRLCKNLLDELALPSDKVEIISSVDPLNYLEGYEVKVNYTSLCNWFDYYNILQKENISWDRIKVKYHFLALSNRPTVQRALFIKNILDLYKKYSLVSFRKFDDLHKKILAPYELPIIIDRKEITSGLDMHYLPSSKIFECLINIVLETNSLDNPEIFITEKSFKPFAWHQIPLFVAPAGHVKKLRELGFDLFDDLFDNHAYNDTPPNNYILKVISVLAKFVKKYPSVDHIIELRHKLWDRIVYNNDLLEKYVRENNHTGR